MMFPGSRRATAILLGLSLAAIVVGLSAIWAFGPVRSGASDTREFTVQEGWGGGRIASELRAAGLIRSPLAFIVIANWTDAGDRLQAGTYLLSEGMTPSDIVRRMASGEALSTDVTVTVPEGTNVWELDAILARAGLTASGSFVARYGTSEGRLFPETYRYAEDATADAIASRMLGEFRERASGSSEEQLIVASILEKEAKSAADMALVAGIIARRMELGMPLQVDATVAYGWCVRTTGYRGPCDVTQAPIATELKTDGPYNTYTRKGLPAGPISNPGPRAMEAAKNPTPSAYLYYLSTRDGSQLVYAETLDEHLKNRLKYLGF